MPRIFSPPTSHLTAYGKFVVDKSMKVENKYKIFINRFFSFQIPYFSKRLILDKEGLKSLIRKKRFYP